MSENNIRELFKMLEEPTAFKKAWDQVDGDSERALNIAKNEEIKDRLGLHIELLAGKKREIIKVREVEAKKEAEETAKAAIKPAQFGAFS